MASEKEDQAKRNVVVQPGKEDVHEQRERDQPREGVVHEPKREMPKPEPASPPQRRAQSASTRST